MDAIRTYVAGAFAGVEQTQTAIDQQAELIADMEAQYAELVAEGMSEAEALGATIAGMGDLGEVVAQFSAQTAPTQVLPVAPVEPEKPKRPEPVDVEVRMEKWKLLTTLGSVFLTMTGLLALGGFYLLAGGGASSAGLLVMAAAAAAAWKAWEAVTQFRTQPASVGTVRVYDRERLRSALMWWAAACVVAFFFNVAAHLGGFWAWAIWVVAAYYPLSIWVGEKIALDGIVTVAQAPVAEGDTTAAEGAATA